MTRIVYVAPFLHEWGTEQHVARDAEKIPGVTVDKVAEPRAADAEWFVDLIERCEGADLLLYTKGHGLPLVKTLQAFDTIERGGTRTASFHLDKYVGLRREREVGIDPMWRTQTVFTADGDPASAEFFALHEVNHRWLPPACVSDECVPGSAHPGVPPVVFIGSRTYHPEWPFREMLISGLEARYGDQFGLYGHDGHRVHGLALNDLVASAKVVVGDSLSLPGTSNYWSDRYYETVGRGGFLLAPDVPGIRAHFTDGRHLELYPPGDIDAVLGLCDYYLAKSDVFRALTASDGRRHVRNHHTYVQRAHEILIQVGLASRFR